MKTPIALWALQAPGLLKQLAKSHVWNLRVLPMGDHENLAEAANGDLANVQRLAMGERPDIIFVCTPAHLRAAEEMMAKTGVLVPIVWVAHNGFEMHLVPADWQGPVLTMSTNNLHAHLFDNPKRTGYVVRPTYPPRYADTLPPAPSARFWMMQNRPASRALQTRLLGQEVRTCFEKEIGVPLEVYGQDQPNGFLSLPEKHALIDEGGVYVSFLPQCAGFGLAEHEVLARGGMLLCRAWGDTFLTLADYPGLVSSVDELGKKAKRIASAPAAMRKSYWENCRARGRDILDLHYSEWFMNQSIARMLTGLGVIPWNDGDLRAFLRLHLPRRSLQKGVGRGGAHHGQADDDVSPLQERDGEAPHRRQDANEIRGRGLVQHGRLQGHEATVAWRSFNRSTCASSTRAAGRRFGWTAARCRSRRRFRARSSLRTSPGSSAASAP